MRERTGLPEKIVVDGDGAGAGDLTLTELEALAPPDGFDLEASWRAVGPETVVPDV